MVKFECILRVEMSTSLKPLQAEINLIYDDIKSAVKYFSRTFGLHWQRFSSDRYIVQVYDAFETSFIQSQCLQ